MNKNSYEPIAHYNRKLLRSVIRNRIIAHEGNSNVSEKLSLKFKLSRKGNN